MDVIRNKSILIGAGLMFTAAVAWWKYRQNDSSKSPPTTWHQVGNLTDLWCYPIKSCGPVALSTAQCFVLGLQKGNLRDRVFMITGEDGNFKTARTYPHMTQVAPKFEDNTLVLKAPGMEEIKIDINSLDKSKTVKAIVWDQSVEAIDCGNEVANWLSQFILKRESGCRLMFYPLSVSSRVVRQKNTFSKLESKDSGAFPDASSFMIINNASVNDLNTRLPEESKCTPLFFRPNFVVSGSDKYLKPYDEDKWQWVKIGNETILKCAKPCTRCIFTNINPKNGIPDKNGLPLKTLKQYRQITDPKLRPYTGDSPVLGVHLALHTEGTVTLGDPIYVGY